jgi:hypothetical protein
MPGDCGQEGRTKAVDDPRLEAMLAVSRAVAGGGPLGATLDRIAEQVAALAAARAVSILELAGERFRIVGNHGLSESYCRRLNDWPMPLAPGRGPAGLAVRTGRPVLVEDVVGSAVLENYQELARSEGYRSIASFPLAAEDEILGTLTIYRTAPGPWAPEEVELLAFFAEHAATAVRTAQLLSEQRRQVAALERVVRRLREQAHEHANRLHAIGGMLGLGEPDAALAFVRDLTDAHLSDHATFAGQRSDHLLSGLLWVETVLARQRSIALELDGVDGLKRLPLTGAQAVTIVGNLLDNAFDAVGEMPEERRHVQVSVRAHEDRVHIRVRDWGPGLKPGQAPFDHGYSTKAEHPGVGLGLVLEAVQAARGRISVEHHGDGVAFVVTLPLSES